MKNKFFNNVSINGIIYESKLSAKVTGPTSKNPGTEFINGDLRIATDPDMTNIVDVHFSYITPIYGKSGKANPNFAVLKDIAEGRIGTVMGASKENAIYVKIDGTMGLNDFFVEDKVTKEQRAVAAKRIEGSFINKISKEENDSIYAAKMDPTREENDFHFDFFINQAIRKEAVEEKGLPEKLVLKGAIFDDFRKSLLPIELAVTDPDGMNYFESLEPTDNNPVFTQVRGMIVSSVFSREIKSEAAWGGDVVKMVQSTNKDYVVKWALPSPYDWNDESTLTDEELGKMIQDREIHLAEVKARQDEYNNSKKAAPASAFTVGGGDTAAPRKYNF